VSRINKGENVPARYWDGGRYSGYDKFFMPLDWLRGQEASRSLKRRNPLELDREITKEMMSGEWMRRSALTDYYKNTMGGMSMITVILWLSTWSRMGEADFEGRGVILTLEQSRGSLSNSSFQI
jgi:hypothetical protein